jgi:K+-sensing histidine kinase KdpD
MRRPRACDMMRPYRRPRRRTRGAPVIKELIGYLLAIPLMGAALVLALECAEVEIAAPYILFLPAIVACGFLGGVGPGMFATLLGGVGTWYFFIPPIWSFDPPSFIDGLSLLLYLAVVLLVCLPVYRQRRAIRQLERRSRDLWKFAALLEGASDMSRPGGAAREHKS